MKRTAILFSLLTISWVTLGQITTPYTASPLAEVSQTIGISTVTINYSRPAVRDRDVWGTLVPFGYNVESFGAGNEAPWRAGANENTTITLSHTAEVGGVSVPAGTYGFFIAVFEDNTAEIILNKDHQSWGNYWYNPDQDVVRAKIKSVDHPHTERLTYNFVDIDRTSANLTLDWEKKRFPVAISFDVDAIVMDNAREELKGTTGFSWQGYYTAAQYAAQNECNLEEALGWANIAASQNPAFNTLNVKSDILSQLGKKEEAKTTKKQAFEVANENQLNQYGYQLLTAGNVDEAIRIFKMNTTKNPKSANAWDSLGEAYYTQGNKNEAKKHFQKALSLDPPANVKANSEKHLDLIKQG
ncbi:MAG: DUF2911 domain-containing protein [Salibacteraceae bacterium]